MEGYRRTLTESWQELRREIIERDGFECQHCSVQEPVATLEVHHIIPVRLDGGDDPENLITLCARCHGGVHRLANDSTVEFDLSILEEAEDEHSEEELSAERIDTAYRDNTPDDWEEREWKKVVEDTEAPARATLTTKHIDGRDYYYWQWRESGKVRSEYVAPVNPA